MKRKITSLLLALALCLGLCAPALAADSEFVIENGVLVKYNGSGGDVRIPDGVTEIATGAFAVNRSFVSSVVIPEGCVKIDDEAFYFLGDLVSSVKVTLPSTLQVIGDRAFEEAHVTQINFPEGLVSIGETAFEGSYLSHVTLPSSLNSLGDGAFGYGQKLSQVSWNGHTLSTAEIENYFFNTPFHYASTAGGMTTPDTGSSENPGSMSSDFVIENGVLVEYTGSSTAVTVPAGVTVIGRHAFEEQRFITQITLPAGVTRIEEQAFQRCSSLSQIILPAGLEYLGPQAFGNCVLLKNINFPSSIVEIGERAFEYSSLTGTIYLPAGLKSLGGAAFRATNILSLTLPDGMDYLGGGLVDGCESLTSITFPSKGRAVEELKGLNAHQFGSYIGSVPSLQEIKNIPSTDYAAAVASNQSSIDGLGDPRSYLTARSDAITAKAEEITAGLSRDYDKASAINQWVAKNIAYDYAYFRGNSTTTTTAADEVLVSGKAVCGGFANLTRALLQAAGIPAVCVHGWASNDRHAWNAAYVDGRWILLDPTWSRPGNGGIYDARYFDASVYFLSQTHRAGGTFMSTAQEMPEPGQDNGKTNQGGTELPAETTVSFDDVPADAYYAKPIKWAVEKNITVGTSKTMFSPNATCTNAQILTFLWRANGSPEPTNENTFTDIKTTDFYYKAALWAAERGLVSGSTFGANTDCTRAMTVEYMWKAAGSPVPAGKSNFTDVSVNADYAQAVAWAVEQKITSGTGGGNFSPAATCTRGQIVTFLYRAMGQ
ncbi:MAG: leucine-rich repeat protein [Oscillospiraceae bacterium]|nr:leucine-rich repeat protein [Oscillospiraceae bacterium]